MARSLRDILGLPKEWPDAGTPEFWEQFGCEGSNEYRDCHDMSADYARLRRLERRMIALAEDLERLAKTRADEPFPTFRQQVGRVFTGNAAKMLRTEMEDRS